MATAPPDNMVLRTIYLPLQIDRRLREIAFSRNISKGELIRELIANGLEGLADHVTLAEQVERMAVAKAAKIAAPAAPLKSKTKPVRTATARKTRASARPSTDAKSPKAEAAVTDPRVLEPAE
jgi:predicted DNA-binding protein